jgi:hypothetical protein
MANFFVNDNAGIIAQNQSSAAKGWRLVKDTEIFEGSDVSEEPKMVYHSDFGRKLPCLFDEALNFFYPVCGEFLNHEKEELRLSVKIAKINLAIDPKNKYYLEQLNAAEARANHFFGEHNRPALSPAP